jgi:hypothetical protein
VAASSAERPLKKARTLPLGLSRGRSSASLGGDVAHGSDNERDQATVELDEEAGDSISVVDDSRARSVTGFAAEWEPRLSWKDLVDQKVDYRTVDAMVRAVQRLSKDAAKDNAILPKYQIARVYADKVQDFSSFDATWIMTASTVELAARVNLIRKALPKMTPISLFRLLQRHVKDLSDACRLEALVNAIRPVREAELLRELDPLALGLLDVLSFPTDIIEAFELFIFKDLFVPLIAQGASSAGRVHALVDHVTSMLASIDLVAVDSVLAARIGLWQVCMRVLRAIGRSTIDPSYIADFELLRARDRDTDETHPLTMIAIAILRCAWWSERSQDFEDGKMTLADFGAKAEKHLEALSEDAEYSFESAPKITAMILDAIQLRHGLKEGVADEFCAAVFSHIQGCYTWALKNWESQLDPKGALELIQQMLLECLTYFQARKRFSR